MKTRTILTSLLREQAQRGPIPRVPEPDLIMDNPSKVEAFYEAGKEDGVLAPVYLFHAVHASSIILPGDLVLDLGVGTANQLALVAKANPSVKFLGVDLSEEMMDRALEALKNTYNVFLLKEDITKLDRIKDSSIDVVLSTVVLHQLPNVEALFDCFSQIRRVLKPGGKVYLVDFSRFNSEKTVKAFSHQYADRQPALFTEDYYNSLRAGFSPESWKMVWEEYLEPISKLYFTFGMKYMVVAKSVGNNKLFSKSYEILNEKYSSMPKWQQKDYKDLSRFFRLGGLRTPRVY
jgi:arsenite methyltransferase